MCEPHDMSILFHKFCVLHLDSVSRHFFNYFHSFNFATISFRVYLVAIRVRQQRVRWMDARRTQAIVRYSLHDNGGAQKRRKRRRRKKVRSCWRIDGRNCRVACNSARRRLLCGLKSHSWEVTRFFLLGRRHAHGYFLYRVIRERSGGAVDSVDLILLWLRSSDSTYGLSSGSHSRLVSRRLGTYTYAAIVEKRKLARAPALIVLAANYCSCI